MTFCDHVFSDPPAQGSTSQIAPKKLKFQLNDILQSEITESQENMKKMVLGTQTAVEQFSLFGRKWMSENKISPDGVFQMALQMAYYKQNKTSASSYEPSMMKRFFRGRTEGLRPCTNVTNFMRIYNF
jgi:hypothetical protein